MKTLILIAIGAALVNNVVLSQFLGLCPFLGVSKKVKTAAGMGMAVIFVITMSSLLTSIIYQYILVPTDMTYLNTIVFILVIAALVQFVEMVLKKLSPALYEALGVYLPLITTNCAVLGVALLNVQNSYGILKSVINGLGTGGETGGSQVIIQEHPDISFITDGGGDVVGIVSMAVLFGPTVNTDGIPQLGRVGQGCGTVRQSAGSKGQALFQCRLAGQAGNGDFLPCGIGGARYRQGHISVVVHRIFPVGASGGIFHQMVIHAGQAGQIHCYC